VVEAKPTASDEPKSNFAFLDTSWWAGIVCIAVAIWIGPFLAERITWFELLGRDSVRLLAGAIGVALIAWHMGTTAQKRWESDHSWSPRVVGNFVAAILATTLAVVVVVFWLVEMVGVGI
jgi:hypothetical protein